MSIERIIETLESIRALDPAAMEDLLSKYVSCHEALKDHPSLQVWPDARYGIHEYSVLSLLNAIVSDLTGGEKRIAAVTDPGELRGFRIYDVATGKVDL